MSLLPVIPAEPTGPAHLARAGIHKHDMSDKAPTVVMGPCFRGDDS
jgi:hypothetical protein